MNRNLYILLISLVLPLTVLKAQYNNIEFVENKGQWDSKIKFVGRVNVGAFYIEHGGFQVLQHKVSDLAMIEEMMHMHGMMPNSEKPYTLHSHSYQVQFLEGNQNAEVVPDKPLPGYSNYFIGNDPSKWASGCMSYQGITVKNIYPNVDVRYYSGDGGVKYDLIVHPGAEISQIKMKYVGVDKLELRNKNLVIGTSVGELRELNPSTFQFDEMKGRKEIPAKFILKNNVVSFDIKDYDRHTTLIIDPVIEYCSFAGSTSDNWGFTATYGPDGSMYGGGIVFGGGFPTSTGVFQQTFQGGQAGGFGPIDIGIIKLNPTLQTRSYATYIGGSGNEIPQSLIVDGQGELIVAGRTNSASYPTFPNNNIGVPNPLGGWDIVLTKLNANGTALIGSKIIGGSADDGANISPYPIGNNNNTLQHNYGDEARSEVMLDAAGDVLLGSCTQSGNFPTLNAFQTSNGGGAHGQDAVVLKFDPAISTLQFSSYLGGNGDDAAYVLDVSPTTGILYVAGGTASSNFPGNHAGTIGTAYNGANDGFVAEISGNTLVRSTYIGTSAYDQIYGIKFDRSGYPYVMGQTTSASWPHINAGYYDNQAKQFIGKLQPDLSAYVYSTVFGKPFSTYPNISPTAFLVDRCENVYVSGWGGCFSCTNPEQNGTSYPNSGTWGMPVTPDALKSTTDGKDFYFFVLKKNATSQLYGSFFGENNTNSTDHVDGGTSRFDANGVIYQAICGNCKAIDPNAIFPTTAGVWFPNNPANSGSKCNLAMLKIAFNLAGVGSGVMSTINGVPRDSAGCIPLTVDFSDTVLNAVSYEWNFGDGSPQITTTSPNVSHTYNALGTFHVMLVAIDSSTCNIRDTSYMNIKVGNLQALPDFTITKLNPCDSFKYRFDNISVAPPIAPFTNTSFIWDFGDGSPRITAGPGSVFHNYTAAGTYNVKLILKDTTYCNAPDSLVKQLAVSALVKAKFTTPPAGCVPYNAVFTNTSAGGQTFQWDFGDGGTSNLINPTHLYATPGNYTITLIATDPNTCNVTDTTRVTILVADNPTAGFTFSPTTPIENTPTVFVNTSSPDAIRFLWKFGDGDSLRTTSRNNVSHQYNATGQFNACLVAYNAAGCSDTVCQQVSTLVIPALDVPNAFTPLNGGINASIGPRGFGIVKMKFTIYNRWGLKVYETSDRNATWDGKYKGEVQPMDVYVYTLEAEFFDGKKVTKTGDITLIR